MKYLISPLLLFLFLQFSCRPETECDTAGYALPEIALILPEGPDIVVWADSLTALTFSFSAEAGLNTFSINGEPIHAFTHGEKESNFVLQRYFWESGPVECVLFDLCNQSSSITLNMTVIQPSY